MGSAQGIPAISVLVLGESLRNAGASALAAREQVRGLMLVAPYRNLPEALSHKLPWLPVQLVTWKRNRFEVLRSLQQLAGPKTLASSTSDGLVAAANASELRKRVPSATWLDPSPLPRAACCAPALPMGGWPRRSELWECSGATNVRFPPKAAISLTSSALSVPNHQQVQFWRGSHSSMLFHSLYRQNNRARFVLVGRDEDAG